MSTPAAERTHRFGNNDRLEAMAISLDASFKKGTRCAFAIFRLSAWSGPRRKAAGATSCDPEDTVHTLVVVHTDEGVTGVGSVFTNDGLVRAALKVLEPLYRGENALEPERVSEKLHQNTFWLGRGGSHHPHHQRHRHRPVGHPGQGDRPAGRPAARRPLSRAGAALCLAADGEPEPLAEQLLAHQGAGFRAFKIGWGPFGRRSDATRRGDRARRARGGRRRMRS